MASRYHTQIPERKLHREDGWSTAAPSDYPASAGGNGLGDYTSPGKGHPLNDKKGVEPSKKELADTEVSWPSAGDTPSPRYEAVGTPRVKTAVVKRGL